MVNTAGGQVQTSHERNFVRRRLTGGYNLPVGRFGVQPVALLGARMGACHAH